MTAREQLWYLIKGVVNSSYEVTIFCDEFERIYNFETDEEQLSEQERSMFRSLFKMASRFSEFEEDLKIPNVYFNKEDICNAAKSILQIENMSTEHNVTFAPGLTREEVLAIEARYEICFPKSLRDFLMLALPVSKGFYNWRDTSEENIRYIKKAIAAPIEKLKELAGEAEWCEAWGIKPQDAEGIAEEVKRQLQKAPVLIPIYGHRYMPMIEAENPPVLSVHGTDVIYYGENLSDYFDIEFGEKKQKDIAFERIRSVPFWSEIM